MALTDAYATEAQYRAAVGDTSTGSDTTLASQLASMSRLLERSLHVQVGAFNAHEATYRLSGSGVETLWLRDAAGQGYFLRSVVEDGIAVDQGSGLEAVGDLDDSWLLALPENAPAGGEPYRQLEIVAGGPLSRWPEGRGVVRIEGAWGYASVPAVVRDLVIHRTHEIREALKAGASGGLPSWEGAFEVSGPAPAAMQPRTFWLWKEAERLYGRRLPVVA